ncbi:hypothetical protein [Actinospica robiniae]|uniref:hypothetical protein n=1 Tax=Actinospica robiniae TaxID=304901 RepID=UPI0003FEB088|nr:hypothetical protein [Actinospica robiniae]
MSGGLEPQDAPPQMVGCPHCRRADEVQRVPMAAANGTWFEAAGPPQDLGRRPTRVVVGSILAVSCADAVFNAWHGGSLGASTAAMFGFVLSAGTAVVNGLGVVGILKRRKRIQVGKPAALAVWNEGWFCRRCGVVYFQPGYEPNGVGLHQALSLAQFQHQVYRAGGYEDLAGESIPRR